MEKTIQEFFTISSFGTFSGASAAVLILTNTCRKLLRIDSMWPAFLFSLIVSIVGASLANKLSNLVDYFIVLLNACLLFWTALGIQETAYSATEIKPVGGIVPHGKKSVKWLSSWLRR